MTQKADCTRTAGRCGHSSTRALYARHSVEQRGHYSVPCDPLLLTARSSIVYPGYVHVDVLVLSNAQRTTLLSYRDNIGRSHLPDLLLADRINHLNSHLTRPRSRVLTALPWEVSVFIHLCTLCSVSFTRSLLM